MEGYSSLEESFFWLAQYKQKADYGRGRINTHQIIGRLFSQSHGNGHVPSSSRTRSVVQSRRRRGISFEQCVCSRFKFRHDILRQRS